VLVQVQVKDGGNLLGAGNSTRPLPTTIIVFYLLT
jgi:hypothetical protein